jgi:hypothetical protein
MKLGGELHGGKFSDNPFRTIAHILPMLGISGDAGEREKSEEFFEIVRHAAGKLCHQIARAKENGGLKSGFLSILETFSVAEKVESPQKPLALLRIYLNNTHVGYVERSYLHAECDHTGRLAECSPGNMDWV